MSNTEHGSNSVKGTGFQMLFDSKVLSDVKIQYGKTKDSFDLHVLSGHKVVLVRYSQYFRNAFTGRFKESHEPEITLLEDDPACMKDMFRWMYDFGLPEPNEKNQALDNVMEDNGLYTVADKYMVDSLQAAVAGRIKANLVKYLEVNKGKRNRVVTATDSHTGAPTTYTSDELSTTGASFPVKAELSLCVHDSFEIALGRKDCPLYKAVVEAFQEHTQPAILNGFILQPEVLKSLRENQELSAVVFCNILENSAGVSVQVGRFIRRALPSTRETALG